MDHAIKQEKTFFVKDEPFLFHKYNLEIDTRTNPLKITANTGRYYFV